MFVADKAFKNVSYINISKLMYSYKRQIKENKFHAFKLKIIVEI